MTTDWIRGELTTADRVWSAAAPAIAIVAFFLAGWIVYVTTNRLRGAFHDEEVDERGKGGLIARRARHFGAWLLRPVWRSLVALDVPPNAITTLSVGMALGAGVALAAGRFALGGWLYVWAGALDMLDGRVARESGRTTRAGAALDSVLDRYTESAVLVGLAWYYRDSWVLFACLMAITGSLFVPYVRARGEALGATMKDVGFFQRPERILLLGLSVALSPIPEAILVPHDAAPPHRVAIAGIVIVALASHATALQRLVHLLESLGPSRRKSNARRTVLRAVTTSAIATGVDYLHVHLLVEVAGVSVPSATAIGCVAGGFTAFAISRYWVFGDTLGTVGQQAARFVFVSGSSAALNAGGVAVLLLLPDAWYPVAWLVTRVVVFATWNYPLLRGYVFRDDEIANAQLSVKETRNARSA